MVFSSIPVYVDPPNWHQQQQNHQHQHQHQHHHQPNGSDNTHLLPPLPPLAAEMAGGGGSMGSIRPGSMADRARLAKIPPPEPALKCPRCDSTNTKFCYFNNYSLTQPRHFCKACRRYWTRGGALRNVPVGGGCRRNKKSKRSRSKSPSSSEKQTPSSSANNNNNNSIPSTHELLGQLPPQPPTLPFMASLQNLSRYGVGNMGLRMGESIHQGQNDHMGFQIGGVGNSVSGGGVEQWRLQQFPFLNGFESTTSPGSNYPFQNEGNIDGASGFVGDLAASSRVTQVPPVKMEDNGGLNLSRSSLQNNVSENNQYFSWTDMSGLASSSTTSHLL